MRKRKWDRPVEIKENDMPSKKLIGLGMVVGSMAGGYLPVLFGASGFSFTSLLTSALGAVAGIYIAYKLTQ